MSDMDQEKIKPAVKEPTDTGDSQAQFSSASFSLSNSMSNSSTPKQLDPPSDKARVWNNQRHSPWHRSLKALRYVSNLSSGDDIKLKASNKATFVGLVICTILAALSLTLRPLATLRLSLLLFWDAVLFLILLFYMVNRLGVLNALTQRQALITWQLIMGALFVGMYLTINLAVLIALVISKATS